MFQAIKRMHLKFGLTGPSSPTLLDEETMDFRTAFLDEELAEIIDAHAQGDLEGVADGLVDLVVVALGTAEMMGLPFDELFHEVHTANMQKRRVEHSGESKRGSSLDLMKPEGWQPPNIARALNGDYNLTSTRRLLEHLRGRHRSIGALITAYESRAKDLMEQAECPTEPMPFVSDWSEA